MSSHTTTTTDSSSLDMNTFEDLDTFTRLFLLIIFLILFVRVCYAYFSSRRNDHNSNYITTFIQRRGDNKDVTIGLPISIINSYDTFSFTKNNFDTVNNDYDTSCSICISDYKESEILRMMPHCRHYFHRNCVDTWLKVNGSCPICRNSLLQANNDESNLERV